MTQTRAWTHRELPAALRWQAVAFIRTHWPSIDGGLIRAPYPSDLDPTYYTATEGSDLLLSMAATFQAPITIGSRTWAASCLGNVFTFPAARHRGLGRAVVAAATADIERAEVDLGALLCEPSLAGFYAESGWRAALGSATITAEGHAVDALRMLLFVSPEARAAKDDLLTGTAFVTAPW